MKLNLLIVNKCQLESKNYGISTWLLPSFENSIIKESEVYYLNTFI